MLDYRTDDDARPARLGAGDERQRVLVRWRKNGASDDYAARVLETRGEQGRGK